MAAKRKEGRGGTEEEGTGKEGKRKAQRLARRVRERHRDGRG